MSLINNEVTQKVRSGEYVLCDKPGRSKVWIIFAKVKNQDGEDIDNYVCCRTCGCVLKYNNTQTSNLIKHKCYAAKFIHNIENTNSKIEVHQSTLPEVENTVDLTKLLTRWIIKDCRPYNLIQNEDLKAVFNEVARLGSKFGCDFDLDTLLPTSSAVGKHASKIYEQCFERVKMEIDLIKGKGFSLTTNMWTNNSTKQIYIALTIHFLKNGVLTIRLLGLKTLESEKNQNIADKIQQILENFDCKLSNKSIIVTDGDCDINKALPNTQNLPCISQLLSNALQKSVEEVPEVEEIIKACFKLVMFLKKMELNNPLEDLMQTSCSNRWQTICKMLNSLNSKWDEIEKILQSKNASSHILTINKHHLKAVTNVFQPFEEAIESLEDDSYATLHLVIVYLHELKKSCDTNDSEFKDFDFIETLKENIRFYLEKIFTENIKTLHKLGLFLYPPTNKLVQFNDQDKKCVEDECIRLMKCFKSEVKPTARQEPETPITPVCKRRKLFSDFVETETNCDPNELILREIQYYKSTRVVNSADFNAFSWWELQKDNFPLLYKLSCLILATPASNAASRRIFSAAGSLLNEKSILGSEETEIERILFIKSNAEQNELNKYFSV